MITENEGVDVDIYELADYLAAEIEESGRTRWSAKDVKNFFLSQGLNLSLDEILQVWNACPSPVCASKLLGCSQIIEASDALDDESGIFTFDFAVIWDYSDDIWDNVDAIVFNVFLANNCDVIDFKLYENENPDPKYKEFELISADVTYTCGGCNYEKLIDDLKRTMKAEGYLVVGNPEFM